MRHGPCEGRPVPFLQRSDLCLVVCGSLLSCADRPREVAPAPGPQQGATTVHEPEKLVSVESAHLDSLGKPVRVRCATCHAIRDAGVFPESTDGLREFHAGLVVKHGPLSCGSCHVLLSGGEPTLHLSDGTHLMTQDTMRLCAQCHGPKFRDYSHGTHGGMTGYWDLSKGSRTRNHCVDCHDPHSPAFAPSRPVLPPRDRFLPSAHERSERSHG